MPLSENVLQIMNATLFGFLFAGVRLQVNNIWPLIILHMLFDTFAGLTGVFGIPEARGIGSIPVSLWGTMWILTTCLGIYFVLRPGTATIDGKPVG